MNLFDACKAYFSPEERIRRHLTKAYIVARMGNYTILKDILLDAIKVFERDYDKDENFPDWYQYPTNNDDIQGMYEFLVWSAKKSGWSSDKLHYIEILYKNAKIRNLNE